MYDWFDASAMGTRQLQFLEAALSRLSRPFERETSVAAALFLEHAFKVGTLVYGGQLFHGGNLPPFREPSGKGAI
eukprot:scaffold37715_cov200-Skeletonema_marinoi.AAC.1